MPVGGGDFGTGTEAVVSLGVPITSSDTGHGTDAGELIKVAITSSDTFGSHDSITAPGELGSLLRSWQLPEGIPGRILDPATAPAPIPGNGTTVKVFSHIDQSTELAEIPAFQSLQYSKLLSDKGAGTIVLKRDDPALWPPGAYSLNPNPDIAGGSLTGYSITGGTMSAIAWSVISGGPAPGLVIEFQPYALRVTGDGVSVSPTVTGPRFPVMQGQGYLVTTNARAGFTNWVTPPGGSTNEAALVVGMSWFDANGALISTSSAISYILGFNPGVWYQLSSGPVYAPLGAVSGAAVVGTTFTPPTAAHGDFQHIMVTYDEGGVSLGDLLIDYENVWSVYEDGVRRFDFLGETVTEQIEDQSEQQLVTITGPGSVATLGWGAAMPPGFPNIVFKTDAIQDGFAEVDVNGNPLLDTSIWNLATPLADIALSPLGTCQLVATNPATYLGASTYDITSSLISAQITPIPQSGLDGSQLTQFYVQDLANSSNYALIGLSATQFYAQVGYLAGGVAGNPVVLTKQLGAYDSNADLYWQISEDSGEFQFWTSPDGVNWTLQWQVAYKNWTPKNLAVFFTATYDGSGQTVSITNLNSNVITPSSQGNIFLLQPIMSVWYQLFQACQARGTIPFITTLLNTVQDSFGNPWKDGMSVQVQNGTDLFSLLQGYAGIVNADWVMQPGFVLQVGLPVGGPTGGVGLGRDLSKQVVVRSSAQLTQRQRIRARNQIANMVGAVNSDGTVVTATDSPSGARWGQREQWIQTAEQVNPQSMEIVVAASLGQTKDEILSWTFSVDPLAEGAAPYEDFDVGDWIGAERPNISVTIIDAVRVIGIGKQVDAQGITTCDLTVSSYIQWLEQQLQYLVNKFGGQFINTIGTTPVTSLGGITSTPTVVTPGLGGLANVSIN